MAKPSKNTTQRNERVADAILDLINAKPRSPTRAELMAALAGWKLVDSAANDNGAPSPWHPSGLGLRPTQLGLEVMRLMPQWYAALQRCPDLVFEDSSDTLLAAEVMSRKAYYDALAAVLDAAEAAPVRHIADLAIFIRSETCTCCDLTDDQERAMLLLVRAVLELGGIEAPSQDDIEGMLSPSDRAA